MQTVFLHLFNMSITASWLALAVILLRFCLKKAPKAITVALWALVGIRLLFPFSVESVFSLIPSGETVPTDILYAETPTIQSGIPAVNTVINPILSETFAPSATDSVNPMQVVTSIACTVWLIGIAAMLVYTAFSYLRLHVKVREAVPLQENVLLCDRIATPFILGAFSPRIYLPSEMNGADIPYVLAHEQAHLKRRDHLWKPLGFLLLTVYWFNPLLWIAYALLCRDIELACDEKVLTQLGTDIKKPYSDALINCSVPRKLITACPLSFGELGVASRVKSVLHYKKPAFWVILIAVIACAIVSICFLTNPPDRDDPSPLNYRNAIEFVETQQEIMAIHCPVTKKDEDGSILVGAANGSMLSKFLTEASWKEFVPPMNELTSPGSVEFILETDYRITVYRKQGGSLFSYATVRYGEDLRYYRIGKDDYDKAVSLLHRPGNDTETVSYESGTVFFYDRTTSEDQSPTVERYAAFSNADFQTFCSLLKNRTWSDDYVCDRVESFRYDGRISCDGWLYFGYEQNIVYYNHYFCNVPDEVMQMIKALNSNSMQTDPTLDELKKQYPEYFGLDASQGLTVYVWQLASTHYSWGLMSNKQHITSSDLIRLNLIPADLEDMQAIVRSYGLGENDVTVTPFVAPISSYIYTIDDAYIQHVTDLFWGRADLWGIGMKLMFTSQTAFDLAIHCTPREISQDETLTTSEFFTLEILHEGRYISYADYMRDVLQEELDDSAFDWTLSAYVIEPNDTLTLHYDLLDTYGKLCTGDYLLCQTVTKTNTWGSSSKIYAVPFSVTE